MQIPPCALSADSTLGEVIVDERTDTERSRESVRFDLLVDPGIFCSVVGKLLSTAIARDRSGKYIFIMQ